VLRRVRILRGCCGDTDRGSGLQELFEARQVVDLRHGLAAQLVSANQAEWADLPELRAAQAAAKAPKLEVATAEAPERAARTGKAGA
jgi:hypothetical protein